VVSDLLLEMAAGFLGDLTKWVGMQMMRTTREGCEIVRMYLVAEGDTGAALALVCGEWLIKERNRVALWRMPVE
jgi:hypothetical protein